MNWSDRERYQAWLARDGLSDRMAAPARPAVRPWKRGWYVVRALGPTEATTSLHDDEEMAKSAHYFQDTGRILPLEPLCGRLTWKRIVRLWVPTDTGVVPLCKVCRRELRSMTRERKKR